jgi:ubiquinol-cytochrome c reductase cytochrome c subunit
MSRDCRWISITTSMVLLAGLLPAAWCRSQPGADDLDREERLAVGKVAFRDNCLMCHGEEMTSRLRLTEKQWVAEIDKMVGWGAPVPPEQKLHLLEYLVASFSTGPVSPPERITFRDALALVRPEGPPGGGDDLRGAALYSTHCATCHGPDGRGGDLGTCLVEKPVLLRPAEYSEVLRSGRRRMPGFAAALKPEQEADILAWLKTRRFEN